MLNPDASLLNETVARHGPSRLADGSVLFRLWAPGQRRMQLLIEGHKDAHSMLPLAGGWHELTLPDLPTTALYQFVLPDGMHVPDPASHFQPHGVRGPSEVVAADTYQWRDNEWIGRPWHTAVLYQLHVGTFSEAGTFLGVIEKLEHLVSLGITAIQLLPIAEFPGHRNWGYDGVFPYACESTYGRPEDLKRLVDEAHALGLMVMLDVVYNHFGPEGNFLSTYAPQFFTERHQTPWGAGINFDGAHSEPVRDFFIDSAVRWIDEFHIDGLRLDAVHAIVDDSEPHFLEELSVRVRQAAPFREVHLVLENEENESSHLVRDADGRPVAYTAQWNDDVHHVLHAAVTGESTGYYADYAGDTQKLGRALAEGFAFQGEMMPFRGSPRGQPSASLPPAAFIAFIQNHDQIGNRACGERINQLASADARRAIAALYLLLPQIPMLFMGEEWDAVEPFPFFCDYTDDLGDAVRQGRRAEFAHLPEFAASDAAPAIPDPLSPETFHSACLDWGALAQPKHSASLAWYQKILATRRSEIMPLMSRFAGGGARFSVHGDQAVSVEWRGRDGARLRLHANLSSRAVGGFSVEGRTLWLEGDLDDLGTLQPWTVQWTEPHG